jgi:hypothetical protein
MIKSGIKCRFCGSWDVTWDPHNIPDRILNWKPVTKGSNKNYVHSRGLRFTRKKKKSHFWEIEGQDLKCHVCNKKWVYFW